MSKCHHLSHLPSGKCLGCGEQHQPLPDYQPGDDEKYLREEPMTPPTDDEAMVERVARALQKQDRDLGYHLVGWNSLGPQTQSHYFFRARAAIAALTAAPLPSERDEMVEILRPLIDKADWADRQKGVWGGNWSNGRTVSISLGTCRKVRAALASSPPGAPRDANQRPSHSG